MKLSRDTWLGIGILFLLVLVTSFAVLQRTDESDLPYLSTSSAPDGTLALSLWLNELGYLTADAFTLSFDVTDEIDVLLITQPLFSITNSEWKLLDDWINKGGTLIISGSNGATDQAMSHFDFNLTYLEQQAQELSVALPIMKSPVLDSNINLVTEIGIFTNRTDYTPLISGQNRPVMLMFKQGQGKVILSSVPRIFTNQELKKEETAVLVLNLLAMAGERNGTVLFDEWHRGFRSEGVVGLSQWLQDTSGGHAILFIVFTIFTALILQGRSFGRPIPQVYELKRRVPLEHVTAIANLNRKAGHRKQVALQYHRRLKRHFGQRYRLDIAMSDEEYVETLASHNAKINKSEILSLLKKLSNPNMSEADLLKHATEASKIMNE